jgi:hypothetical protein
VPNRGTLLALSGALAIASVLACSSSASKGSNVVGRTRGDLGNASFAYAGEDCVLFVCTVGRPLMVGSTEPVEVTPMSGSIPVVTASTSDPAVLKAAVAARDCCKPIPNGTSCRSLDSMTDCASGETASVSLSVTAAGPGHAKVLLVKADGSTYDSLDFASAPAASLVLSCRSGSSDVTDLAVASTCLVHWKAADANGAALQSSTGVTLAVSPLTVAGFEQLFGNPTAQADGNQGTLLGTSLVGLAAGDASVTATLGATPAVHASLGLHVH